MSGTLIRLINRFHREISARFSRRMVELSPDRPIVSFTFDDFPISALEVGGEVLRRFDVWGTYYVSLGLMDRQIPAGQAFSKADVLRARADGHELGCHTYAHCHSWDTESSQFERSVVENEQALRRLIPGASFYSHSYPIAWPRPLTKRLVGRRFGCCRGGGQTLNCGATDLNLLSSFFLEKCGQDFTQVERILERNRSARGWLIFSTHDVSESPTRLGCTPAFLQRVVECALESGAAVLPVSRALAKAWVIGRTAGLSLGRDGGDACS